MPTIQRLSLVAVVLFSGSFAARTAQPSQDASSPPPSQEEAGAPLVYVAEVDGVIHPVSAEYMIDTMEAADAAGAALLVFVLRTPGGLVDSTRSIIERMIAGTTPVAVYVGPSGARAASAGFLLTIAADVAAMAPGTTIGAAHPVSGTGEAVDETVSKKAASDVAAYARTLATKRGRNVEFSEQAVLESRSFTDGEALEAEPPLIDLVTPTVDALIAELDGRTISRFDGREVVLRTADARVEWREMTWRQRLLSAIAHPQVAYLLFSLGTLGLVVELWNPGSILPGVVGGLCLLLAFFAFDVLPVNYAGLLLMLFGMGLLVLEVKVASFGILATGGIVSLVLGSVMLFDAAPIPEMRLALEFVLPFAVGLAAILLGLVYLGVQALRRPAASGVEGMQGARGRVLQAIPAGGTGRVAAHGEIWNATSRDPIDAGEDVEVESAEGLTLTVRRLAVRKEQAS